MAKYAYVSSVVGTNTTTDTSFSAYQSDAFGSGQLVAANCYAKIQDALDNITFADGDVICFASNHNEITTTHTTWSFLVSLMLISVDVTNGSNYLYGAKLDGEAGLDQLNFLTGTAKIMHYEGMNLNAGDDLYFKGASTKHILNNCRLRTRLANYIAGSGAGVGVYTNNCTFAGDGQFIIRPGDGGQITLDNAIFDRAGTGILFRNDEGACKYLITNTDLSSAIASTTALFYQLYNVANLEFKRCKIAAGQLFIAGGFTNKNIFIDAYSCDNGSGYHYFEHHRYEGEVKESTQFKRTGGATYDGTNGFSSQFLPSSGVQEFTQPLSLMLNASTLDLSGGDVTLRVHFLLHDDTNGVPASLTSKQVRIRAVYPDATTLALGDTVYSYPTEGVLSAGTTLPTETKTFTGDTGDTKQHYIELTIPQNASMSAAVCELWLELSAEFAQVTTEMFVCPSPTVT